MEPRMNECWILLRSFWLLNPSTNLYGLPHSLAFPNFKGLQIHSFSCAKQLKQDIREPVGAYRLITKETSSQWTCEWPTQACRSGFESANPCHCFSKSANPPESRTALFAKQIDINTASGLFRKFLRHLLKIQSCLGKVGRSLAYLGNHWIGY